MWEFSAGGPLIPCCSLAGGAGKLYKLYKSQISNVALIEPHLLCHWWQNGNEKLIYSRYPSLLFYSHAVKMFASTSSFLSNFPLQKK